jgi:hypothetical protein
MKLSKHTLCPAKRALAGLMLTVCLASAPLILAQESANPSNSSLPDAPQPQGTTNSTAGTTTRFVGYMTNRSFIFPDIAFSPGPLTAEQKFKLFVNQSISPPYIFAIGVSAAYGQARNSPEAYGQGWNAYGSRFDANFARASSDSFFSSFAFASVLQQDPRFFPQNRPRLADSIKYAAQRVFVTRTDSGKDAFNASSILGTVSAEALANVYLPRSEQTVGNNCERVGTDLAWKFAANMFKNYWPTVFHGMGLNRLKVIPAPQ